LARAFEEHVRRVVQSADNALLFLQYQYEANGRVTEEIVSFIERTKSDPILNQISLVDSRGDLRLSALPLDKPINISQREHFQVQAASADAGLHIGKPVLTKITGTWSFFLSRRLNRPDGSFAGIVSVGLNPACFSDYYDTPALGPDLSSSPMLRMVDTAPSGHYEVTGSIDSQRRFVSYRALPDLPLLVAVSSLTSTALAPYQHRAAEYRLSALVFTLFVGIFCLVLIRAERRTRRHNAHLSAELIERHKAEEALNESQGLFSAFLDHIPAVVFVQDLQGRILYSNQAFKDFPGRESIGRNARDLLAPLRDDPPGNPPALRGRSIVLDESITDSDGRERIFEARMFIVERKGKAPLLGCISVDNTGRRHAEEERLAFERRMQQAQKLESLGVLAGGIAHDFNNLLMVILGNADLANQMLADATQLRQVVMNLITNASDAIDDQAGVIEIATGVVEVGLRGPGAGSSGPPLPKGRSAFLEISDTGHGMDQVAQALIFDPFFTTKQTGRGLGLASVLGIVKGHDGEIRVSSKPGQGTTFTVLLPAAAAEPPANAVAAGTPVTDHAPPGERRCILLVDDEEHVRQTTPAILEESGFTVVTAADGIEGVEVFRNQAAQLSAVVLDMNMPRMDGAEAFRQMHGIAPSVPVILTSGFDEQDAVNEFTATGLAHFIQKPYRMKALLQAIEAAIAAKVPSRV